MTPLSFVELDREYYFVDIGKVLTRQQAEEKAKELGWTVADARRAFDGVSFPISVDCFLKFCAPMLGQN